jgi:CRP-like cAMP-binding protein
LAQDASTWPGSRIRRRSGKGTGGILADVTSSSRERTECTLPCFAGPSATRRHAGCNPEIRRRFLEFGMASRRVHQNRNNRILQLLSRAELRRLQPDLETVQLKIRDELFRADEPISHVYFPISGVMSLVVEVDEKPVEVSTIGNEGMVGVAVFLGATRTTMRAFAQVPGDVYRMKTKAFRAHLERDGELDRVLRLYVQAFMTQITQNVLCNIRHSVEQRMCRWLLITHDRVGADEFPLTQDFLSQMLGVRRATVTVVAGILQRRGLIAYHHGRMRITDRRALQAETCVCYRVVRREYERLLG